MESDLPLPTLMSLATRLSLKINLKGWRRYVKSVVSIIDDSAELLKILP